MSLVQGAIAANRFGMGAKPGEIDAAASDPRGWLKAQIKPDAALVSGDGLKTTEQAFQDERDAQRMIVGQLGRPNARPQGNTRPQASPAAQSSDMQTANDQAGVQTGAQAGGQAGKGAQLRTPQQQARQMAQRQARDELNGEIDARTKHALETSDSFSERWARFWSNHFTVAAKNRQLIGLAGPYEREAIRPHVYRSFGELLGSASFHPAMLIYLDANKNFGPSTDAAKARKVGLNENLAREILELHTMGVGSGYTQADVTEFARALTGWTVGGPQTMRLLAGGGLGQGRAFRQGGFGAGQGQAFRASLQQADAYLGKAVFVDALHEPGARTIVGKTYKAEGKLQAAAVLDDLARSRATAKHISTKLARHFVSDTPPDNAVKKLEAVYMKSGGDLSAMARACIDLDEAWGETALKFKSPDELLISVGRSAGQDAAFGRDARTVYASLAQQPFGAQAPVGWPDDGASWSGADAVMKRLQWANSVSQRIMVSGSPNDFLNRALGPTASEATRTAVSRAETAQQGFTLALMSPEFQRR